MTLTISNPSPQLSTVLRWYDAVTTWNFDVVDELFPEDYQHTTLPSSANQPPKNKAQGLAFAKGVAAQLGYTPLKYEIIQFSDGKESIWVHSKLHGEGPDGSAFSDESIFIFTLRASGDKFQIVSVQDFIDTKKAADIAAAAGAAAAAAAAKQ